MGPRSLFYKILFIMVCVFGWVYSYFAFGWVGCQGFVGSKGKIWYTVDRVAAAGAVYLALNKFPFMRNKKGK